MTNPDHHATIRAALEYRRQLFRDELAKAFVTNVAHMRLSVEVARIDAALAYVEAIEAERSQPQPAATGWPHSEGYFAFEGHIRGGTESFRDVFEVAEKNGALHVGVAMDWEPVTNLIGTWTKLRLPWEPRPAAPDAMPTPEPDWADAPEWAMWWAVDKDNDAFWYEGEPRLGRDHWQPPGYDYPLANKRRWERDGNRKNDDTWKLTLHPRPATGEQRAEGGEE